MIDGHGEGGKFCDWPETDSSTGAIGSATVVLLERASEMFEE
jgi:hypothetical protein